MLPTCILFFLPMAYMLHSSHHLKQEGKKGLPILPTRAWKKRNSRNYVQCSSASDCHTNGFTINQSIPSRVMEQVYASALCRSASMQMLRKGHSILSTGKDCIWFHVLIIVVPPGERDRKEKQHISFPFKI